MTHLPLDAVNMCPLRFSVPGWLEWQDGRGECLHARARRANALRRRGFGCRRTSRPTAAAAGSAVQRRREGDGRARPSWSWRGRLATPWTPHDTWTRRTPRGVIVGGTRGFSGRGGRWGLCGRRACAGALCGKLMCARTGSEPTSSALFAERPTARRLLMTLALCKRPCSAGMHAGWL